MGTYATTTSFSTWLIGTTMDSATTSLVGQCITWAEDEVNKQLGKRYDVSAWAAATTPPIVRSLTQKLATGYFYQHNARGGKDGLARGSLFEKQVMDNLKMLAEGKLELVDTAGSLVVGRSTRGVLANTDGYSPTFAEDDPLNWRIDPDKLDDVDSDRD